MHNLAEFSENKELLGQILVRRNVITEDQLNQALELQKKEKGYVGELLIRLGHVEERDIVVALIVQCNLPYIAIDKYDIDKKIVQLIPEDLARENNVIALDRVGDILSIVMANPLNTSVKTEIQRTTNCKVATFIATKDEINKAIDSLYGDDD